MTNISGRTRRFGFLRPIVVPFTAIGVAVVLSITAVGCGDGADEASATSTSSTTAATTTTVATTSPATGPQTADGTLPPTGSCAPVEGGDRTGSWFLTALRQARNGEGAGAKDRVVWEFRRRPDTPVGAAPSYVVESVDPPYKDDPGDVVLDVPGTTGLRVRFRNATAVDMTQTEPTRTYTGERKIVTGREPLTAVVDGGDFEGTSTWLLGLSRKACPVVSTLDDPVRVVVDVPVG